MGLYVNFLDRNYYIQTDFRTVGKSCNISFSNVFLFLIIYVGYFLTAR